MPLRPDRCAVTTVSPTSLNTLLGCTPRPHKTTRGIKIPQIKRNNTIMDKLINIYREKTGKKNKRKNQKEFDNTLGYPGKAPRDSEWQPSM